jgi:hypothetical protein
MSNVRLLARLSYLVVAGIVLLNAGCLAVALGTAGAAGAAALAYTYANGRFYREYPTKMPEALEATRTALKELQLPIEKEEPPAGDKAYIESKTGDGDTIKIYLETIASRIPAEGSVVRIGVRVGPVAGDQTVSTRILDQINLHLVAPVQVRPEYTVPPLPPPQRLQPETPPPPLVAPK